MRSKQIWQNYVANKRHGKVPFEEIEEQQHRSSSRGLKFYSSIGLFPSKSIGN